MNDSPKKDQPQGDQRAAYQPPEVVRVSLRPEEAVLGHCKTTTSTGPAAPSCSSLHCRTSGS